MKSLPKKRGRKVTRPKSKTVFLPEDHLLTPSWNMNPEYRQEDLEEMRASIEANQGVLQALRVVPVPGRRGYYYVEDGNKRLAGGRLLGKKCPLFECKIVQVSRKQQLLNMIVSNKVRSDPDVIAEATHYQTLKKKYRMSEYAISKKTGVHVVTINNALAWLKLEPEIRKLVSLKKLHRDRKVVNALLTLPRGRDRIRLATLAAEKGLTIKGIVAACEHRCQVLKDEKGRQQIAQAATRSPRREKGEKVLRVPSLELAQKSGTLPTSNTTLPWPDVRKAAKEMCSACNIKTDTLVAEVPEPAWALITHAAKETCGTCKLPHVESTCRGCPGIEIIRRMIAAAKQRKEARHGASPT